MILPIYHMPAIVVTVLLRLWGKKCRRYEKLQKRKLVLHASKFFETLYKEIETFKQASAWLKDKELVADHGQPRSVTHIKTN